MKRQYRLRSNTDFQRVRRSGETWVSPCVVLCALPNGLQHSRFGFVVSKRLGKAVVRNSIKRRLREIVRLHMKHIAGGWDVVFIARQPITGVDYRQLEDAVRQLLHNAKLLYTETLTEHTLR